MFDAEGAYSSLQVCNTVYMVLPYIGYIMHTMTINISMHAYKVVEVHLIEDYVHIHHVLIFKPAARRAAGTPGF